MDGTAHTGQQIVPFKSPGSFLSDLTAQTVSEIIGSAADVALFVERGFIRDIALRNEDLTREGFDRSWIDRPWIETVTEESRPKIADLLEGTEATRGRWRQVNHPSAGGLDVAIQYIAVGLTSRERIVALGRDLRPISQLQQRLVEAHQSLEREYSRLRQAEARYLLLLESVSQPVLIVDSETRAVEEVNSAAVRVLGATPESLPGSRFEELFSEPSRRDAIRALADAVASGHGDAADLETEDAGPCDLRASAFHHDGVARVIVRLEMGPAAALGDASQSHILSIFEALPDGFVVAGGDLRILAVNRAFVEMAHFVSKGQAESHPLSSVLGRSTSDLNVLVSNLKSHGAVRNFATVVRDRFGNEEDVEVSGAATVHDDSTTYGFAVRSVARRLRADERGLGDLPRSADQLTSLVGRMPLREIVRQSTDLMEKLCIEAALEITNDNRASAAELLGLSRQGLYSKLRRFGIDASH